MNARSRNVFASAFGYQNTIDGQPNPESKAQFRARKLKEVTRTEESRAARVALPPIVVAD